MAPCTSPPGAAGACSSPEKGGGGHKERADRIRHLNQVLNRNRKESCGQERGQPGGKKEEEFRGGLSNSEFTFVVLRKKAILKLRPLISTKPLCGLAFCLQATICRVIEVLLGTGPTSPTSKGEQQREEPPRRGEEGGTPSPGLSVQRCWSACTAVLPPTMQAGMRGALLLCHQGLKVSKNSKRLQPSRPSQIQARCCYVLPARAEICICSSGWRLEEEAHPHRDRLPPSSLWPLINPYTSASY